MMVQSKKLVLLMACLFIFLLGACSAQTQQETSADESQNSSSGTASTPGTSTESSSPEGTRKITHAMGETEVPLEPQRVVVLDNGALDNVLALGIKPVGAPTVFLEKPFPDYLSTQSEGIEQVGTIDQPSLEAITALSPDLIFGTKDTHEAIYEQLNLIAPTVFVETLGTTWKENLALQAEALGKADAAEQLLADYSNRLEEFKSKIGDQPVHVSLLRARLDKVNAYLRQSFSGRIIEEAGLSRPSFQQEDKFSLDLTEEMIPQMNGDVIFWFTRDQNNLLVDTIMKNPLWTKLDAVKENRVYEVSAEIWLSGLGIQAANLVLDDLFAYLVQE